MLSGSGGDFSSVAQAPVHLNEPWWCSGAAAAPAGVRHLLPRTSSHPQPGGSSSACQAPAGIPHHDLRCADWAWPHMRGSTARDCGSLPSAPSRPLEVLVSLLLPAQVLSAETFPDSAVEWQQDSICWVHIVFPAFPVPFL